MSDLYTWVRKAQTKLLAKRQELKKMDPKTVIECIICSGASPVECGCEGICTVEFALTFVEGELEILSK